MPRQSPEVLAGTRGPRTERIDSMRAASEAAETEPVQVGPQRRNGTVYVSKFRRYRVQVTAPADVVDPLTGRKTRGVPVKAQFEDGVYVNDTKDLELRAKIDTYLQENPYFGKYGSAAEFWLASDQESTLKAAKLKSARDTLKSLPPEAVAAFVAELQQGDAEDHVLPPR